MLYLRETILDFLLDKHFTYVWEGYLDLVPTKDRNFDTTLHVT